MNFMNFNFIAELHFHLKTEKCFIMGFIFIGLQLFHPLQENNLYIELSHDLPYSLSVFIRNIKEKPPRWYRACQAFISKEISCFYGLLETGL